jgi:hypothetical protein
MGQVQILNFKHQITNKSQTPILNDQNRFAIWNFGHWKLFVIWDLLFGIFFDAPLLHQTILPIYAVGKI